MLLSTFLKQNKPLSTRRGCFTTAYLYEDKVLLKSRDPVKECFANGWMPDSPHLPSISYSELDVDQNSDDAVYESPRYLTGRSVKQLVCKADYEEIYLPLRKMFFELSWWERAGSGRQAYFHRMVDNSLLRESMKEVIKECYDAMLNYDAAVGFEISPRNVAATADGTLILLDCFFLIKHLNRK